MLIVFIVVLGMAAGFLAQLLLRRDTGNRVEALVAGLVGSFVGGLLVSLLAGDGVAVHPSGLIGSVVGAVLVLLLWGALRGRTASSSKLARGRSR